MTELSNLKWTVLVGLLIPIFLSCGGGASAPAGKTAAAPVKVEGFVVKEGEIASVVQASGTVIPEEETVLYPEVSGRVVVLSIPEGQMVGKGKVLVKLYDGDLQAQLQKLELQIQLATETEKRLARLLSFEGVSKQEHDEALLQLNVLKADAEILRVQIGKTEIRAPFDGVVGLKQISEGAFVTPQTPLCTIRTLQKLKLDFSIPEKYSSQIMKGMEVSFKVEGDTTTHTAKIEATESAVEQETRNLKVRARILSASNGKLLPGAFAEVNVPLGLRTGAILIPSQAVIPQARNKMVIVNRGGKASFVPVITGVRQSAMIEIQKGLVPGDTIATTGIMFIRPDSPITFSEIH